MLYRTTLGLLIYATVITGCLASPKESAVPDTSGVIAAPTAAVAEESPVADAQGNMAPSFLIVPNKSFGPITADFTESDLKKAFGEANVRAEKMYVGDGMEWDGYAVYPDSPEKRLEVFWAQEGPKRLEYLQVVGEKSQWKTAEGVTLGTTLLELEELNGGTFELLGLDWDFGGGVSDWHGGKLEGLTLQLGRSEEVELSQEEMAEITGEQTVQSDHPAIRKVNPKVMKINMAFPVVAEPGY